MNVSTAWVEGAEGDGLEEWIVVSIDGDYQYLSYEHGILNKKLNITLKINNGFCKSEATFKNNNRVKKQKSLSMKFLLRLMRIPEAHRHWMSQV